MTGQEFDNIVNLKIDKTYSGFFNPVKKNRLYKEALVLAIETKYKDLQSQKVYDEITKVIKTNVVVTPTNNNVTLIVAGSNVVDYEHLLAIKIKYAVPQLGVNITDASDASPIVIKVDNFNSIRTSEQLNISGVLGNTAANGSFYVNRINRKEFQLFSDANLTMPVAGNGKYVPFPSSTIKKVSYNYAKPYYSDRKISALGEPDVEYPYFEIQQNSINLYPMSLPALEVAMDYITKATVFIISTDTVVDLENTYPIKFLYYIADVAANLFAQSVKDTELFQTSNFETQKDS